MPPDSTESFDDLRFREFIKCTVKHSPILADKIIAQFELYRDSKIKYMFKKMNIWHLRDLMNCLECSILMVKKTFSGEHQLILDTRYLDCCASNPQWPVKYYLLVHRRQLIACKNLDDFPCLTESKIGRYSGPEQPLQQLLNVENEMPLALPQNCHQFKEKLLEWVAKYNPSLQVWYYYTDSNNSGFDWWRDSNDCGSAGISATIEVFTRSDYTLGFRKSLFWEKMQAQIEKQKSISEAKRQALMLSHQQQQHHIEEVENNMYQRNHASAVSVKLSGLNLAYHHLALLTLEEFQKISLQLAECAVAVWFELDDAGQARYATVSTATTANQHLQVNPGFVLDTEAGWEKLWDHLFKLGYAMENRKKSILGPLLHQLQIMSIKNRVSSPWKKCLQSLRKCIRSMTVLVYSDAVMHSLKLNFTSYVYKMKVKYFKGVLIKTTASNDLAALLTRDMRLVNMEPYQTFSTNSEHPSPGLKNEIKWMKKQKKWNETLTMLGYCEKRGTTLSRDLLQCWIDFGQIFMTQFRMDIFSLDYNALSYLSYNGIWLKYAQDAGPLHHALERCKVSYEKVLRQNSHGGFMYSCRDKLNVHDPIFPEDMEEKEDMADMHDEAKTLMEYDISSSYGYAGSTMQTARGFCVGYIWENDYLAKTDPVGRHNSFEFKSVYYTIWKFQQQHNIHSVFSNFHLSGIFKIGSYPLDLVIITKEGLIYLFQFDGVYVHGCRAAACQDRFQTSKFVGGKSRYQVEEDTAKRDEFLMEWCEEMNDKMLGVCGRPIVSYHVLTDCHDPEYNLSTLKNIFDKEPQLAELVQAYPTSKILTVDDVIYSSEKLTFLALVRGFVPSTTLNINTHPVVIPSKPILCRHNSDENIRVWQRQSHVMDSDVIMTKDFLTWLRRDHNFQVTQISQVFFYRTCSVLPDIFKQIIYARMNCDEESKKSVLKNIVNLSCGFYGLQQTKSKKIVRLVQKLGSHVANHLHRMSVEMVGTVGGGGGSTVCPIYLTQFNSYKEKNMNWSSAPSNTPLPLYLATVEFGKMRLSHFLCFLEKYLKSGTWRHLYSNTDNLILALTTHTLDEAVEPLLLNKYLGEKCKFFQSGIPGHLKLEWTATETEDWKFISNQVQHWTMLTNGSAVDGPDARFKNSSLNGIVGQESYRAALARLQHLSISLPQTRRVNKILNTNTVVKNINLK